MKSKSPDTLLLQWQPPSDAGEPVGCLATTFTFDPGFFEEQCLSRFLRLDSLPERGGLAYLLERESRLGTVTASVLVDRSYAGVDHAMRWDVLPVHIPGGVQHAKVCVLAWSELIRIIISSANLTEQAYRRNFESVSVFDARSDSREADVFDDCIGFISSLMTYTIGHDSDHPAVSRATSFLESVSDMLRGWSSSKQKRNGIQVSFAATLPQDKTTGNGQSSLEAAMQFVRKAGNSPASAFVASPFWDDAPSSDGTDLVVELSGKMGRGVTRTLHINVPALNDEKPASKLGAPRHLYEVSCERFHRTTVATLPLRDPDGNFRPWHAKMLRFEQQGYHAVMIGSSNFTRAGMGVGNTRNAEANVVYLVSKDAAPVTIGKLLGVWPELDAVSDPDSVDWCGAYQLPGMENGDTPPTEIAMLPLGFVTAVFRSGQSSELHLRFRSSRLPDEWSIFSGDEFSDMLYGNALHDVAGRPEEVQLAWTELYAPGALQVRWSGHVALWPVNVEDPGTLPLPKEFKELTADDILWYIAAARPSHAISQLAKKLSKEPLDEGDMAIAPDLDPLRRYNLATTFLHRVRARARLYASVRDRLSEAVWSEQALLWRLKGPLGAAEVLKRLCRELEEEQKSREEAVLNLADFILMLSEVTYREREGYLPREKFDVLYRKFQQDALRYASDVVHQVEVSEEIRIFWNDVSTRVGEQHHV